MVRRRDILEFADEGRLKLELLADVRAAILPVYEAAHQRIRKLIDSFVARYRPELDDDERFVDSPATGRAIRLAESDVRRLLERAGNEVIRHVVPFMQRSAEQIALEHLRAYAARFWPDQGVIAVPEDARRWLMQAVRDIESWHVQKVSSRISAALRRARYWGEIVGAVQDELVALRGERRIARMYAEAIGQFFAQVLVGFGRSVKAPLYLHVGVVDKHNVEDITRANPPGLIHPAFAGPNPRKGGRPGYGSRDFIGRILGPQHWELVHPRWHRGKLHYGERGLFYPVPAEGDVLQKHREDVVWLERVLNRWAAATGQPLVRLPTGGAPLEGPPGSLGLPPPPAGPSQFPPDPDQLRVIRPLPGSTGPVLVEDAWGRRYVRKRGGDHVREEYYAEEIYRAMGVRVPPSRLYERPDGTAVKLSVYIEPEPGGKVDTLGVVWQELSKRERDRVLRELRKGFVVDAWLANWDVIGLQQDNILVRVGPGKKGRRKIEVYRIDLGGALRYRAQGMPKGSQFGEQVMELWTLRDPQVNPQAAQIFGGLTVWELPRLAARVDPRKLTGLPIPADLKALLRRRARNIRDTMRVIREFQADTLDWREPYVDRVARFYMLATSIDQPRKLSIDRDGTARTPSGKLYHEEMYDKWRRYMEHAGLGSHEVVERIAAAHGIEPTGKVAVALRTILESNVPSKRGYRRHPADVWQPDQTTASEYLAQVARVSSAVVGRAIAAAHAWTIRNLELKQIPGQDPRNRTLLTARYYHGAEALQQRHRVVESCSVEAVANSARPAKPVMLYRVPFIRVWWPYWVGRKDNPRTSYYVPGEREILVFLEGIHGRYVGRVAGGTKLAELE